MPPFRRMGACKLTGALVIAIESELYSLTELGGVTVLSRHAVKAMNRLSCCARLRKAGSTKKRSEGKP